MLLRKYTERGCVIWSFFLFQERFSSFTVSCQAHNFLSVPEGIPLDSERIFLSGVKDHHVFVCNSTISLSSQDNHLKVLPDNIFVDLHNLSHLFLHGNRLWSLNQNTFRGPRALDRLLLHQNQIEWVDHSAFQDLKHLSTLYLFNNSLLQLSRQCLDMLPSLEYLRLNNNPWVCDCRALSLWLWLKQFRGSTSTVGCQSPPEMIGKDLKDLRREEFPNCSLTVSNSRGQTNNVSGTVNQSTTNLVKHEHQKQGFKPTNEHVCI
uniref:Reticulon 4 receptor-like 1b n=1 Tax=Cynoglossus semilaevis TaxID=244447 RepID=A0A3P8W1I3_CYNSE